MEQKFNVLIIGAGKIGAFFDNPSSTQILTHAHAFNIVEAFNIIGFCDVSIEKSRNASKIWGGKYYYSIKEAFLENNIDVVSICVPDEYHYYVLKELTNYNIKIVFAEKPLTQTLEEAIDVIKTYNNFKIKCLVNYSRRFVSEFKELKNKISKGIYGKYISGSGYYGKGILHNGSHLIDFLRYMIGDISNYKIINCFQDFYNTDKTISSVLYFKDDSYFVIQGIPCTNYTIFEMEFLFEKGKIKITDLGYKIEEYVVRESEVFAGYKNLYIEKTYATELGNSMKNAVINIKNHLINGESLNCSLEDAYEAMKICESLKEGTTI